MSQRTELSGLIHKAVMALSGEVSGRKIADALRALAELRELIELEPQAAPGQREITLTPRFGDPSIWVARCGKYVTTGKGIAEASAGMGEILEREGQQPTPGDEEAARIDTADVVFHGPSGEQWVVAFVRGERLAWCGWPQGEAKLADCELVKKATPEARERLLREMANMNNQSDARCRYATAEFRRREGFGPNGDATTPGFFRGQRDNDR